MNWSLVILFLQTLLWCSIHADIYVRDNENNTQAVLTDYELTIGLAVPDEGILAVVQQADPTNACSALTPPDRDYPAFKNKSYKWFALVDRAFAYCDIQTKLINVMNASFDGVIIYNANVLSPMRYPMFVVNIPVILVSHSDGVRLSRRFSYRNNFHLLITNNSDINYYQYLIPFLAVIGICLLVMLSFMISQIIRCYHERKKEMKHRLSKKHLKKLPIVNFKKGDQYEVCAICLDEFTEGTKLRVLPCGHAYHLKCIDPWLTKNRRNCPICKGKVVVAGMSDTETDSDIENRNANSTERTPLISGNSSNYGLNPFARRSNRTLGPFTSNWNSEGELQENSENPSNSNEPEPEMEPTPSSSNGTMVDQLIVEARPRATRTKKSKRTRLVNIQAEITPNQEIEESTSSSIPYEPLGEPSTSEYPSNDFIVGIQTVEDIINSSNSANGRNSRRSDGIV